MKIIDPKNILMLNLTRMGDLIQSTPLLKGLREKYPDAKITLLVGSDFYEFSKRLPVVDNWIVLNLKQFKEKSQQGGVSWIELYQYFEKTLNQVRDKQFDLVFNLSHSKLSAFIISYLKIKEVRGFKCNSQGERMTDHPWLQYFFTEPFNRPFNTFNLVDLFSKAGDITLEGKSVEIKESSGDSEKVDRILKDHLVDDKEVLIGFQAGSSLEGRRWPASHFAKLGDRLIHDFNARIVLFGVKAESKIGDSIVSEMKSSEKVINLIGKTDITALTGLVGRCDYLITNDTGTMHIAAALNTTIVGLFFAHAHPPETGPYSEGQLLFQADIPCAPCSYGVDCNDVVCVEKLSPEYVGEMVATHIADGKWSSPLQLGTPKELKVFVTERAPDSCLRMRRLNSTELSHTELFSWIYRRLWLDTLGQQSSIKNIDHCHELVEFVRSNFSISRDSKIWNETNSTLVELMTLKKMGEAGAKLSLEIMKEIKSQKQVRDSLVRVADQITKLDQSINLMGLTHLEIKPITDMFNKRKENIDGNDLRVMAEMTLSCYEKLILECEHLTWLAGEFTSRLKNQATCEVSGVTSIRMEVPGR